MNDANALGEVVQVHCLKFGVTAHIIAKRIVAMGGRYTTHQGVYTVLQRASSVTMEFLECLAMAMGEDDESVELDSIMDEAIEANQRTGVYLPTVAGVPMEMMR